MLRARASFPSLVVLLIGCVAGVLLPRAGIIRAPLTAIFNRRPDALDAPPPRRPREGEILYHHLYVGADGTTRMARDVAFGGLEKRGSFGAPQYVRLLGNQTTLPVTSTIVTQMVGDNPWHYCPAPQFVVTLAGEWYITTGDGQTTTFRPGDILYQDNVPSHPLAKAGTRAAQHYSGVVEGSGACNQLVIQVERAIEPPGQAGAWS